jgi:MFS family permease
LGILAYGATQFARQNYAGVQMFIGADLGLDRAALGLLGSVFFYTYALSQMPWGVAADKFGSRWVAGLSVLLTAGSMAGFATSATEGQLLFWRAVAGFAGAAIYVAMAGGLARWFTERERGLSQGTFGGVGGALGEGTAFFLLPVLSVYFASGWRQGTVMVAAAIAAIGVFCLIGLRSAPPGQPATTRRPFEWALLADPLLWRYTFLFSGFVVAIRVVQPWIAVYAADVYIARRGLSVEDAVIAGGLLALMAYSVMGRGLGCAVAGRASDALMKRGVSRVVLVMGWLVTAVVLLQLLVVEAVPTWALGVVAFGLGVSVNSFPLVTAAISEAYGPARTASIVSFVNTFAQLAGATALALSGYIGVSLSAGAGHSLSEYRGIWLSAMAGVIGMMVLGAAAYAVQQRGWGRAGHSAPVRGPA